MCQKETIDNMFICNMARQYNSDRVHIERILIKASDIYYALIKFKTEYNTSSMTILEKTNVNILANVTMENDDYCYNKLSIQ